MLGRDLLAATVTRNGQVVRSVTLPKGEWFNFQTGAWISRSASDETGISNDIDLQFPTRDGLAQKAPLFARDGAIIPVMSVDGKTMNILGKRKDGSTDPTLRLKIFSAGNGGFFDLIEDDAVSTGYLKKEFTSTKITLTRPSERELRVVVAGREGTYAGVPGNRGLSMQIWARGRHVEAVTINGNSLLHCPTVSRKTPSCWSQDSRGRIAIDADEMDAALPRVIAIESSRETESTTGFFICENADTQVGTFVYVVGNSPLLGNWNPEQGVRMDASAYPVWTKLIAGLNLNQTVEWKCVKRREGGNTRADWQQGGNNILSGSRMQYAGPTSGSF